MPTSPDAHESAARRVLWIFAFLALLAVAVVFIAFRPGTLTAGTPVTSPAPSTAVPTVLEPVPPTHTPAEAAPGNWQLPEREWEALPTPPVMEPPLAVLGGNVFYSFPLVAIEGCPEPSVVADEDEWRHAVEGHWTCLHTAFTPIFEQMGAHTMQPGLHFFEGPGADSPCGWIDAPAFYCSANNGSVHFGGEHLEMALEWDLAVTEMVSHEYGHHIQAVTGMTEAKLELPDRTEAERRAELQAICWSGALTLHTASVGFGEEEFRGWEERVGAMVSSDVHGSRESLDHWGMRGLWASSFGDCNTWVVDSGRVR